MPDRTAEELAVFCPVCGFLDFANWRSCSKCKRLRRRRQIRASLRKRRREKRHEAARVDRVADLRRRLRTGELLPLVVLHVASGTWWLLTTRRNEQIAVTPSVVERVFPRARQTFGAFPTHAPLLVLARSPYSVGNYSVLRCLAEHTGAIGELSLAIESSVGMAVPDSDGPTQLTEAVGGCSDCTASMSTIRFRVRIQPTGEARPGDTAAAISRPKRFGEERVA
jgi:hypothetical protein